jgi:hypothetical protein
MRKLSKNDLITFIIILAVIIIAIFTLRKDFPETDAGISKCIGENSILYSRLGCHFCEEQKKVFGDNYQYLTVVDCFFETDKCADITSTPTWIINGKSYIGVQKFDKLKELTGC